jgi:hypothetical protein
MSSLATLHYIQIRIDQLSNLFRAKQGSKIGDLFSDTPGQISNSDLIDAVTEKAIELLKIHANLEPFELLIRGLRDLNSHIFKSRDCTLTNELLDKVTAVQNLILKARATLYQTTIDMTKIEPPKEIFNPEEWKNNNFALQNLETKYLNTLLTFVQLLQAISNGIYGDKIKAGFEDGDTDFVQPHIILRLLCIHVCRSNQPLRSIDCFKQTLRKNERLMIDDFQRSIESRLSNEKILEILQHPELYPTLNQIIGFTKLVPTDFHMLSCLIQSRIMPQKRDQRIDIEYQVKVLFLCGYYDIAYTLLDQESITSEKKTNILRVLLFYGLKLNPDWVFRTLKGIRLESERIPLCYRFALHCIFNEKPDAIVPIVDTCIGKEENVLVKEFDKAIKKDEFCGALFICAAIENVQKKSELLKTTLQLIESSKNQLVIDNICRVALYIDRDIGIHLFKLIVNQILTFKSKPINYYLGMAYNMLCKYDFKLCMEMFILIPEESHCDVYSAVLATAFKKNQSIAIRTCPIYNRNLMSVIFRIALTEHSYEYFLNKLYLNVFPEDHYIHLKNIFEEFPHINKKKFLGLVKEALEFSISPSPAMFAFYFDHSHDPSLLNKIGNRVEFLIFTLSSIHSKDINKPIPLVLYVNLIRLFDAQGLEKCHDKMYPGEVLLNITKALLRVSKVYIQDTNDTRLLQSIFKHIYAYFLRVSPPLEYLGQLIEIFESNLITHFNTSLPEDMEPDINVEKQTRNNIFIKNVLVHFAEVYFYHHPHATFQNVKAFIMECSNNFTFRRSLVKGFTQYYYKVDERNVLSFIEVFNDNPLQIDIAFEYIRLCIQYKPEQPVPLNILNQIWGLTKLKLDETYEFLKYFSKGEPLYYPDYMRLINTIESPDLRYELVLHFIYHNRRKLQESYIFELLNSVEDEVLKKKVVAFIQSLNTSIPHKLI